MDKFLLIGVFAVGIIGLVGFASANGMWGFGAGNGNWPMHGLNWSANSGMLPPDFPGMGMGRLGSGLGFGPGPMRALNSTQNASVQAFVSAVLANDFSTAKQLSDQYGFGKGLMSVITAEQFSRYPQMLNDEKNALHLRQRLVSELAGKIPAPALGNGKANAWAKGFGRGFKTGFGMGAKRGRPFANGTAAPEAG